MKISQLFAKLVAGSALLGTLLLGTARADTSVQVKEIGLGKGMATGSLTLPLGTANWWSGFQTIQVQEGAATSSFLAFCLDPFQYSSATASPYTKTTLNSFFSAATIDRISDLFNYGNTYATALTSNTTAGALQLALWEVANDNGVLGTGSVRTNSGTNATLVGATQSLLTNSLGYNGPSNYTFTFYKSGNQQDFIVATPVPEPGTYGMMLVGVGLIGTIAARRRKNKGD
ncbi:MAG: PEP-CTERM sorting domain-containing protein [Burkholderiales bacterium]|nr:PEP-CTERM sorting domain-containing protein [Burkholderiales bacterium]